MNLGLKKKITTVALVTLMLFSISVAYPSTQVEAASGHTLDSLDTKTVYGDPNDSSAEAALAVGLIAFVPGLGQYKTLDIMLKTLGVAFSVQSVSDQHKQRNEYKIYKWVYKSNNPTSTYWGYYQVDIYNKDLGETFYGDHQTIGKTGA